MLVIYKNDLKMPVSRLMIYRIFCAQKMPC